jgi:hypothetical protein
MTGPLRPNDAHGWYKTAESSYLREKPTTTTQEWRNGCVDQLQKKTSPVAVSFWTPLIVECDGLWAVSPYSSSTTPTCRHAIAHLQLWLYNAVADAMRCDKPAV